MLRYDPIWYDMDMDVIQFFFNVSLCLLVSIFFIFFFFIFYLLFFLTTKLIANEQPQQQTFKILFSFEMSQQLNNINNTERWTIMWILCGLQLVWSKNNRYFQISLVTCFLSYMFDFRIFFCCYVCYNGSAKCLFFGKCLKCLLF